MTSALIASLLVAVSQLRSDALTTSERLLDTHLWPKYARVLAVSDDGNDVLFIDGGWILGQRYRRGYIIAPFQYANTYKGKTYSPTELLIGGALLESANADVNLASRDWLLWPIEPRDGGRPIPLTLPFRAKALSGRAVSKKEMRLFLLTFGEKHRAKVVYEGVIKLPTAGAGDYAKVSSLRPLRYFPSLGKSGHTPFNGWIGFARDLDDSAHFLPSEIANEVRSAKDSGQPGKLFLWNGSLYKTCPVVVAGPAAHFRPDAGLWKWDARHWRFLGERNCEAISPNGKWAVLKGPADSNGRWTYFLASSGTS